MAQITNKRLTLLNNSGTAVLRLGYDASNFTDITPNSSGELNFGAATVYVNDTANANMTVGLTLNQGANDDETLTLKSSDVAHGMTTLTETDTYLFAKKDSATEGGALVHGYSEGTVAVGISANATTSDTTKSASATGAFRLQGNLKSGTNVTALGADANILVLRSGSNATHIFDADGDSHQDVGTAWTNFDDHDDVALLTALSAGVSRPGDRVRESFGRFLEAHRETLEANRLVTFNEDGRHFINWSRTNMLVIGAVRQLAGRLNALEARLANARLN